MSGLDTAGVENMSGMFMNYALPETVYAGSKWSADGAACDDMFTGCSTLTGGEGIVFDSAYTGKDYARIDGGISSILLTVVFTSFSGKAPSKFGAFSLYLVFIGKRFELFLVRISVQYLTHDDLCFRRAGL